MTAGSLQPFEVNTPWSYARDPHPPMFRVVVGYMAFFYALQVLITHVSAITRYLQVDWALKNKQVPSCPLQAVAGHVTPNANNMVRSDI